MTTPSSGYTAYRKNISEMATELARLSVKLAEGNRLSAKIALFDAARMVEKERVELAEDMTLPTVEVVEAQPPGKGKRGKEGGAKNVGKKRVRGGVRVQEKYQEHSRLSE